jgi:hypothetical protein
MHHNAFENDIVRVLDVHLRPGDTSLFHKHETPSVFIVLTPARTGSEVIMEEAKATALSKDASISFEGFYITPRVHRVWNEDTLEFHVMDIELLHKNQYENTSPIQQKGLNLIFDEKPVRGYRLILDAGGTMQLQRRTPFLVVGLTDATEALWVNKKTFIKKGDYLFIPAGQSIQFINKGPQSHSFAVLELK